ncbi:uncharacterized protein LOC126570768 [Anopheles aquasalis]|uniref:uncharacterized protein LOC126570768 n=1 Tax=Anopheles aquasalis TaxID=42839 RepID=UPI00215A5E28|nr:uncharacterized protein LOC126570768 [Anopheles aquasalis]
MLNGFGLLNGSNTANLIVYEGDPTDSLFNPMDGGGGGGGGGLSVDFYNKRQFVKVNETVFVEEVKKRPILYDTGMRQNKRIKLRTEAWHEVSLAVNLSVQECRKRWRSMRDAFLKQVRTKSEEERKCWVHYRLLEFLLPYITQRQARHAISSEEYEHDYDFVELDSENENDLYDGEPMTVSYVTEDGDELFQVLHTPSMPPLPDTALINVEDTDFTDGGEEGCLNEAMLATALIPQGAGLQEDQLSSLINQNQSQHTDQYGRCAPVPEFNVIVMSEEEVESDGDVRDKGEEEEIEEMEGSHHPQEKPQQTESRTGADGQITSILYEEHLDSTLLPSEQPTTNPNDQCVAILSEALEYTGDGEETDLEPDYHQLTSTKRCISADVEEQTQPKRQCDRNTQPGFRIEEEDTSAVSSHVAPVVMQRLSEPTKESDARLGITDSDERFLLSCAPILQQLPAKKNHLARLKIQQLLYELQYDEKYNCETSN